MAQPSYDRQTQYQQQVLQMPETLNSLTNISSMSQKPKQSRLELMKQNYEKKRQKDIEERLTEIRAQEARAGSGKHTNGGGTVRSFFAERRAMEANAKDPYALPPIDRHFKKVKDSSNSAPPRQRRNGHEPYVPPAKSNSAGKRRVPPQYYRKKSKGVDKQNPLPPLQQGQSNSHKPPTPNKRYETHNTLMNDNTDTEQDQQQIHQQQLEQQRQKQQKLQQQQQQQQRLEQKRQKQLEQQQQQLEQDQREQQQPFHVPQPPQQPNPLRTRNADSRSDFDFETSSNYSEEPPPNLTKLKALRQKRLSKQMSLVTQQSVEKPTDFQKWQMEQDRERAERLEKHRQKTTQQESEAEVTLSMRERELLEKIKAEQDKLKEIKRLQQELEEQEQIDSDNEDSSTYDLTVDEKVDQYHHKQNSYENRIMEKTHEPVQTKTITKAQDNKSNVRVQPKKEKVAQVTINKPPTPDEEETEENEPKEDFAAYYEQAAEADTAVDLSLSPCSICGRNFATDRLARHEKICNKNSKKTRKVFDVQKQRVAGLEHAKYVVSGQYKKETPKPKKADWRTQHQNFIKTIRYAKGASDEPPPVMENPHYVACPYCERKFNPETAERHIPRCKDIKARPAPPKNNIRRKR